MLKPDEADRARESLGEVLGQIDSGDLEATKTQRAVISGAASALEAQQEQPEEPQA